MRHVDWWGVVRRDTDWLVATHVFDVKAADRIQGESLDVIQGPFPMGQPACQSIFIWYVEGDRHTEWTLSEACTPSFYGTSWNKCFVLRSHKFVIIYLILYRYILSYRYYFIFCSMWYRYSTYVYKRNINYIVHIYFKKIILILKYEININSM